MNAVPMAIFRKQHRAVYNELSMNLMAEQGVFEKCVDGLTVENLDAMCYHEDNAVDKKHQYSNKKTEDCLDVQIKKYRKLSKSNEENCWGQECAKLTQAFVDKPLWSEICKEKLLDLDCMFRLVDHPDGTPLEEVVARIASKLNEAVFRTVALDENVGMVIRKGAMALGKANSADRQTTTEFATSEEFVISNDAETIKKDSIGCTSRYQIYEQYRSNVIPIVLMTALQLMSFGIFACLHARFRSDLVTRHNLVEAVTRRQLGAE